MQILKGHLTVVLKKKKCRKSVFSQLWFLKKETFCLLKENFPYPSGNKELLLEEGKKERYPSDALQQKGIWKSSCACYEIPLGGLKMVQIGWYKQW